MHDLRRIVKKNKNGFLFVNFFDPTGIPQIFILP